MPTGYPEVAIWAGARPDKSPEPVDNRRKASASGGYVSPSHPEAQSRPDLWTAVQRGKPGELAPCAFRHPQPTTAYANRPLIHRLAADWRLRTLVPQLLPRLIVGCRGAAA